MEGRRSQSAVRRESVMYTLGGVLVVAGAVLVVAAFVDDTRAAREAEPSSLVVADTTVPSTTTPTTVAPPPRTFTLAATGDLLAHSPVNNEAKRIGSAWGADYDYRPLFEQVKPILSAADLALCHLETPLAATSADVRTGGIFEVPSEIVGGIADAGYDGCSTASNHSIDGGEDAIVHTLGVFDAHALGYTGTARSPDEATSPPIYDTNGVGVAHLSYTYGTNGLPIPDGREYLVNLIDPDRIIADAAAARDAGAQVVVVSLHWGTEFSRDPTSAQVDVANRLSASPDVDLVVGHHAHVVQPVTRVGDLVVAYGLGNFLSNQSAGECCPAASQDGVIVQFRFTETGSQTDEYTVDDIAYTATIVDRDTFTILPVTTTLTNDPDLSESERRGLETSRRRTDEAVHLLGPLARASGS